MAVRDILVCLDAISGASSRLDLALNLAQTHKARLTAVFTTPQPRASAAPLIVPGVPPTVLGPVSPEGAAVIGSEPIIPTGPVVEAAPGAEQAEIIERIFREELPQRGLDGEWSELNQSELAEIIQLAKTVDMTILGQSLGHDPAGMRWLRPDDVMIDTGRPVLIIPAAGVFDQVGKRVLIAWDGTREANRALHDSLPLLAGAEMATVIHFAAGQADIDRDRPWLERITQHLRRHGVQAQPEESLHRSISVRDALLARAAALGADMIVAGAYHHSPLRESVLGGLSRGLLDHMTTPVLMSH